ncbi:MAG: hypothetical protein ACXVNO_00065 [Bacteroidia bacterium]
MSKATKLTLYIVGGVLLLFLGLYGIASIFSPGSYPNAERYELNYSEEKVIHAINKFKADHPEFSVPKVSVPNSGTFEMEDGKADSLDHWYNVYFYYAKENIILHTWTRPITKNKTTFAFIGINNGLTLGNWQEINDDLGFFENRKTKKEFEERILKQIQNNLK